MKSNSFFKKFKKDLKNKKEHKKALFFLFLFILVFSLSYLLFAKSPVSGYINYFFGFFSSVLLSVFGASNSFVFDSLTKTSSILVSNLKEPIVISFLCSGILEFSLLISAILSSVGISLKKRIFGALLAIPVIIFFNLTRIVVTSLIIINDNLSFANFVHGFLFRLFLIIIVIGTYYVWFRINTK
jgi:exosortase/archaeosortase family protein